MKNFEWWDNTTNAGASGTVTASNSEDATDKALSEIGQERGQIVHVWRGNKGVPTRAEKTISVKEI